MFARLTGSVGLLGHRMRLVFRRERFLFRGRSYDGFFILIRISGSYARYQVCRDNQGVALVF